MKYTNFDQLNGKTLERGDDVIFNVKGKTLPYSVSVSYLSALADSNEEIFKSLFLDAEDFTTQCYGYENLSGSFPECQHGDMEALTRVTLALFAACEGCSYVQIKMKDGKWKKVITSVSLNTITIASKIGKITKKGVVVEGKLIPIKDIKTILTRMSLPEIPKILGEYTPEIYPDYIEVGCQEVTKKEIENIIKLHSKLK